MATTAPTPVDDGPPVPTSSDPEATFDAQYEAFNAWEKNTLRPGMNALAEVTYDNAQAAETAAAAAGDSETAASEAATAAGEAATAAALSATTASTQAGIATTQAGIATAAAGSITAAAATATAQAGLATAERIAAQAAAATASAVVLGVSTGLPTVKPALLLDFANSRFVDGRVTCALASASTRVNESGAVAVVAANTPRLTFDAATGQCLGKMGEEGRANLVRNNTMVGAALGTPGTVPSAGWFVANTGTHASSVVAVGVEDGVEYIDVQFVVSAGAPQATLVYYDSPSASAAAPYTQSAYLKLVGGAPPQLRWMWADGVNTSLPATLTAPALLTRVQHTYTTSVGATLARAGIGCEASVGGATFVLRIGLPQIEPGLFATSVIKTSGTSLSRAAESAYLSGSNFSSWYKAAGGTIVVDGVTAGSGTHGSSYFWSLNDGTSNNRIGVYQTNAGTVGIDVYVGGVLQASLTVAGTLGSRVRIAASFANGAFALSVNGSAVVTAAAGSLPAVNQLQIGYAYGTRWVNGQIRNLAYYAPGAVANAQLPLLSAIS